MKNECISLQIGNNSNYIGSQLWNLRDALHTTEEIESDDEKCIKSVYYHSANDKKNPKPRCVAIDLNENFGHKYWELFDPESLNQPRNWHGQIHDSVKQGFANHPNSEPSTWSDLISVTLCSVSFFGCV